MNANCLGFRGNCSISHPLALPAAWHSRFPVARRVPLEGIKLRGECTQIVVASANQGSRYYTLVFAGGSNLPTRRFERANVRSLARSLACSRCRRDAPVVCLEKESSVRDAIILSVPCSQFFCIASRSSAVSPPPFHRLSGCINHETPGDIIVETRNVRSS